MVTSCQLLAGLLCGLLVTGCGDTRSAAVSVHVHLDASLPATLPEAADDADHQLGVGVVVGLEDPDLSLSHPHHPAPLARHGGGSYSGGGQSTSLGGINLGAGREAGLILLAVVAVVLVGVVVWKIGAAVAAPHAAAPTATYALALGGGTQPAQLLHIRDGHTIRLDPGLVDALAHGGFARATLQKTGSPVALPVLVALDGALLSVRPVGAAQPP